MNDDFLIQVRQTEEEAANILERAKKKSHDDLEREAQRLEQTRTRNLEAARADAKKSLAESQDKFRKGYDVQVEEGKIVAADLEKEAMPRIEKTLPGALSHLLNDLI